MLIPYKGYRSHRVSYLWEDFLYYLRGWQPPPQMALGGLSRETRLEVNPGRPTSTRLAGTVSSMILPKDRAH